MNSVGARVSLMMWGVVPVVTGITALANQPWLAASIYAVVIALIITLLALVDNL